MQTSGMVSDGTSTADTELQAQQASISAMSLRTSFQWLTCHSVGHTFLATVATGGLYVLAQQFIEPSEIPEPSLLPHLLVGILLGLLLVVCTFVGSQRITQAATQVIMFSKCCRTLSLLAAGVSENLTISAGADLEKKALATFRYELVRYLNLAFYCYSLMLRGLKMQEAPSTLAGQKMEQHVLAIVGNPVVQVCKWIASLVAKQRVAGRIKDNQAVVFESELVKLIEIYHTSHAMLVAPLPAMLSGFTYTFVVVWVYSFCPVVVATQLAASSPLPYYGGLILSLSTTAFVSLFFFGLYEAGRVIEAPIKQVISLVPIETLTYALSDDLSNLIDDPDNAVPVFLPRPA